MCEIWQVVDMEIGKEYSSRRQDSHQSGKNPGVYSGDLNTIMIIYGFWGMSMSNKGFFGNRKRLRLSVSF